MHITSAVTSVLLNNEIKHFQLSLLVFLQNQWYYELDLKLKIHFQEPVEVNLIYLSVQIFIRSILPYKRK